MRNNFTGPKKSLGQNFLVNRGILEKIISAADLLPDDTVLEIGPGEGILTGALAAKAGKVLAVEKDHRLIEPLRDKFASQKNVEIVEGDILEFPVSSLQFTDSYKIVGNIPYYITSHLLKIIFDSWPKPKLIILMVQKEVAQRILATGGKHSILSLSVQYYAEPKIVTYVSRGSFRPVPNVDSVILRLIPKSGQWAVGSGQKDLFFKLIKAGFSSPRKKLISNLSVVFPEKKAELANLLEKLGLPAGVRAEALSLQQWISLAESLST